MSEQSTEKAQVQAVARAMSAHALAAWRSAEARRGLRDYDALVQHADAMSRWSERLSMAIRGDLVGDEAWLTLSPGERP